MASIEKSDSAFRTIGEAAEQIGVAQHVLRFWESRFPQLQPLKRGGGRRYYRPADMALLETIRAMLHDEGLTIRGAQQALGQRLKDARSAAGEPEPEAQPATLQPVAAATLPAQTRLALFAIRNRLAQALAA
jgi:DNA-binding transcriptional MerR regulator